MQKPTGVTVSSALMGLFIVIGIYAAFATPLPATTLPPATLLLILHVIGIVFGLIAAVFVWFYYQGQNWARWLVMIVSVLSILKLFTFAKNWRASHLNGALLLAEALLGIFLLWYLNTSPVRDWFEKRIAPPTA